MRISNKLAMALIPLVRVSFATVEANGAIVPGTGLNVPDFNRLDKSFIQSEKNHLEPAAISRAETMPGSTPAAEIGAQVGPGARPPTAASGGTSPGYEVATKPTPKAPGANPNASQGVRPTPQSSTSTAPRNDPIGSTATSTAGFAPGPGAVTNANNLQPGQPKALGSAEGGLSFGSSPSPGNTASPRSSQSPTAPGGAREAGSPRALPGTAAAVNVGGGAGVSVGVGIAPDPRLAGGDPRLTGIDPRLAGGDPRLAGGDPRLAGTDPRLAGADPRLAGSDPRLAGTDPRLAGADPRLAGSDPRLAGADPRLAGADPRLAGADPRLAGVDPRLSGADPRLGGAGLASMGGTPQVIAVKVGNEKSELVFEPNVIRANIGDMIQFQFFPKNHSVARSSFSQPCMPLQSAGAEFRGSFFSGFAPTDQNAQIIFTIPVEDDKPIWFYCSQGKHCQAGMVGVINPPPNRSVQQYAALAKRAEGNVSPLSFDGTAARPFGGQLSFASNAEGIPGQAGFPLELNSTKGAKKSAAFSLRFSFGGNTPFIGSLTSLSLGLATLFCLF